MTMHAAIPVAVAGGGRVALAVHLPLIAMKPELFDLVAIIETDPRQAEAVAREYPGITVAPDLDTAFARGARALICATPWPTHRAIVVEALRRGIHVLTEKPVSLDPAEISVLLQAERASDGTVAVGYMKRHDPAAIRFIDAVASRLDRLRRISVDIIDPDSPHQVAHRMARPLEPSSATRAAAERALRSLLGDRATDGQLAAYGRGLGGSLIHQINLIHTVLSGSPHHLLGRIRHGTYWAGGSAVSCGWWPAEHFGVQMSHIRTPHAPRYTEVIEAVAGDCRLTLSAPSPYLLEQGMTFTEEIEGQMTVHTTAPHNNGFVRQLEGWAVSIHEGLRALPGLAEALNDLAVAQEAALTCTGALDGGRRSEVNTGRKPRPSPTRPVHA